MRRARNSSARNSPARNFLNRALHPRRYVRRSSLRTLGNALGPLVSICIFLNQGDDWDRDELKWVLCAGIGASLLPASVLFFFKDEKAIGASAEALHRRDWGVGAAAGESPPPPGGAASPPLSGGGVACCCGGRVTEEHIAPLVALSDLLSMLGAGMTARFFSLFCWRDLGLRPVAVSTIQVALPIGIAVTATLVQRVSVRLGRIPTTLLCRLTGIGLLVALTFVPIDGTNEHAALIVGLYLVRTWLMNCTSGLTKSVLNDYVRTRHRSKWNALESLNLFSWSGSAALGGYLIDHIGYQHTFLVTAGLQLCAAMCLVPIAPLVQSERRGGRAARAAAAAVSAAAAGPTVPPLLAADAPTLRGQLNGSGSGTHGGCGGLSPSGLVPASASVDSRLDAVSYAVGGPGGARPGAVPPPAATSTSEPLLPIVDPNNPRRSGSRRSIMPSFVQ